VIRSYAVEENVVEKGRDPPKCSDDYINFVIASPRAVSATEAAKVQGDEEQAPAHDAFTRLLHRLEPDAATLWREAESQVGLHQGILVIDDSTQGLRPTRRRWSWWCAIGRASTTRS
jgi:hypothetical protein